MTVEPLSYTDRPRGPRAHAELLCPTCRGLLAVGWVRGPEAAAALGTYLGCPLCRTVVLVDAARAPGASARLPLAEMSVA